MLALQALTVDCVAEAMRYAAPSDDPRWLSFRALCRNLCGAVDGPLLLTTMQRYFDALDRYPRTIMLHDLLVMCCQAFSLEEELAAAAWLDVCADTMSEAVVAEIDLRVAMYCRAAPHGIVCWPHASPMKTRLMRLEDVLGMKQRVQWQSVDRVLRTVLGPFPAALCGVGDWVWAESSLQVTDFLQTWSKQAGSRVAGPFQSAAFISDHHLHIFVSSTGCALALDAAVDAVEKAPYATAEERSLRVLDMCLVSSTELSSRGTNVQQLHLPRTLTRLPRYSFRPLRELRALDLRRCQKLKSIESFEVLTALTDIKLPVSVERVTGVSGASALTAVDLSSNVRLKIIDGFGEMRELRRVSWPPNLSQLLYGAFMFAGLAVVDLRCCARLTFIAGLSGMEGLELVRLPASLTVVAATAFRSSRRLVTVDFRLCASLVSVSGFGLSTVREVIVPESEASRRVLEATESEALRDAVWRSESFLQDDD